MVHDFIRNMFNGFACYIGKQNIKINMEAITLLYGIGVLIIGGIYLWTFTKSGKKWLKHL